MATPIAEHRWYHVGPHGYYDLVRLARRGRSTLVRVCYVLALFAALAAVYYNTHENELHAYGGRHSESINLNARIAERFSIAILVMQNVAVLLLMPIYIAAGVHEERDKRTLPLLFTTHLTAREIVRGKWVSRVGHVGGVLLGGLPILCFVQLWGGIDMPMIAANFCNTGFWLLSVAAFSLMIATQSRSLIRSVVKTYLFLPATMLIVICCCLPFEVSGELVFLLRPFGGADGYWFMWMIAGVLAVLHLNFTYFCLRRAAANLEAQRGDEPMPPDVFDPIDEPVNSRRYREPPPVWENAVLWKERCLDAANWSEAGLPLAPLIMVTYCLILLFPALLSVWHSNVQSRIFNDALMIFETLMFVSFGFYALFVSFRLTGCVVREHERQTLDSLLTLPITSGELLNAKLKGNLLRYRTWLWPIGIAWVTLMLMSGWNPIAGLFLAIALAVHFLFFAMLGLFLSVICRTSVSAYVTMGVILLFLFIGTVFAAMLLNPPGVSSWLTSGLNPVGCWLMITDWWRTDLGHAEFEIIACLSAYALAAFALWKLACWRFGRISSKG
jgi:ABC-type transport system involved in multi-copper enzyme maturation permease subunit